MVFFRRRNLKIAPALYDRMISAAAQAGYATADEFALHVLEQATKRIESQSTEQQRSDQQQIDQQLRGLGYLE